LRRADEGSRFGAYSQGIPYRCRRSCSPSVAGERLLRIRKPHGGFSLPCYPGATPSTARHRKAPYNPLTQLGGRGLEPRLTESELHSRHSKLRLGRGARTFDDGPRLDALMEAYLDGSVDKMRLGSEWARAVYSGMSGETSGGTATTKKLFRVGRHGKLAPERHGKPLTPARASAVLAITEMAADVVNPTFGARSRRNIRRLSDAGRPSCR
jgi:hypothetical protein